MMPLGPIVAVVSFLCVMGLGLLARARGGQAAEQPVGGVWNEGPDRTQDSPLAARLRMAGFEQPSAANTFRLRQALAAVTLGALAGWLGFSIGSEPGTAAIGATVGGLLGWRLPMWWLDGRVQARRADIRAEFPVMLDLLQISMQGGLGLHAAWTATAEALQTSGDALAAEMRRVDIAVGLGTPWGGALSAAADASGEESFRSLGSLLGQTQRFGTEVAQMIRVLCDSLRHDELQDMEERAHRMSVRMLLPLAGLLLPATLLLVVAPLLLMLFESLEQATSD
jgi:tight adherence protein C